MISAIDAPLVLVADDDVEIRLSAERTLQAAGFRVVTAENGYEAVELCRRHAPQLILLDAIMPEQDGFSACEQIRRLPTAASTPVVFATASDDVRAVDRAYAAGATDFVVKPICWSVLCRRLRYMHRAAQTLRRLQFSEARHEAYLAVLPDLLLRLRSDGLILDARPGEDGGVLADALPGVAIAGLFGPQASALFAERLRRAADGGTAEVFELSYAAPGGERWLEVRLSPCEPGAVIAALRDISERKQAEQRQRYFEVILSLSSDPMSLIDRDYRYLAVNRIYTESCGKTYDQIVGGTVADLHGEEAFAHDIKPLLERCLSGENVHERHWTYAPGAEPRYLDVRQVPFRDGDGTVIGAAVTTRDITELKHAERALEEERSQLALRVEERTAALREANEELNRALKSKDAFLASMSHELRTPLNAILGLSEALQEQVFGDLTDRQVEALQTVEQSGRHLLSLINDILDVARVGSGEMVLKEGEVGVAELCASSVNLVRPVAAKKRLRVATRLDPAVETVHGDARRLKQVLVNLLSNAVKFTPSQGEVGLELEGNAERGQLRLTVWDTGIGIAREDQLRLFEPFVQVDNGLSRQYEGTGLGLTLVRQMVELHGGGVSVESAPGRGSRFTVTLPWRPADPVRATPLSAAAAADRSPDDGGEPAAHTTSAQSAERPCAAPLLLLAEDNEANIRGVYDYLRSRGYRLTLARDGAEAVRKARETKPDLILMDIQMPDMDGLEAIRRLRGGDDPVGAPIIALTALAMPGDRERCLSAGADDYLSKPVGLKDLSGRIGELLAAAAV